MLYLPQGCNCRLTQVRGSVGCIPTPQPGGQAKESHVLHVMDTHHLGRRLLVSPSNLKGRPHSRNSWDRRWTFAPAAYRNVCVCSALLYTTAKRWHHTFRCWKKKYHFRLLIEGRFYFCWGWIFVSHFCGSISRRLLNLNQCSVGKKIVHCSRTSRIASFPNLLYLFILTPFPVQLSSILFLRNFMGESSMSAKS